MIIRSVLFAVIFILLNNCYASQFENLWNTPIKFNKCLSEYFLFNHMYQMKYLKSMNSIVLLTGDGMLVYNANNGIKFGRDRNTVNYLPECLERNIYIGKNEKTGQYELKTVLEDILIQSINSEERIIAYDIVENDLFYFAYNEKENKRFLARMNLNTGKKIIFADCNLITVRRIFITQNNITLYGDSDESKLEIVSFNINTKRKIWEKTLKNREVSYPDKVLLLGEKYCFIDNNNDDSNLLVSVESAGKESVLYRFTGYVSSIISASKNFISVRNTSRGMSMIFDIDNMKLFREISSDDRWFDRCISDNGSVLMKKNKLRYFDFDTNRFYKINQYKGAAIIDANNEDPYIFVLTTRGKLQDLILNKSVVYLNCIVDKKNKKVSSVEGKN